jgi:hypothetical protein
MNVTSSSATLQGAATPLAATTTAWFRYSTTKPGTCDDSFGTRTLKQWNVAGSRNHQRSLPAVDKWTCPGTTYYYCAIANNTLGMGFGSVKSFTTPAMAPTVTTSSATNLTRTARKLTGYANPGGDPTTAWFRYGPCQSGNVQRHVRHQDSGQAEVLHSVPAHRMPPFPKRSRSASRRARPTTTVRSPRTRWAPRGDRSRRSSHRRPQLR